MTRDSATFACRDFQNVNRRHALKVGGLGMLGLSLPRLLQAEQQKPTLKVRAKRVIFLFQWGGPSHVDMFDMKPNAPDEIRGPYKPISSAVPGMPVCELMPEMAKRMDRVTLIRSVTHTMKNHNSAGYYALTGHAPPRDDQRLRDSLKLYPGYGSVVDHLAPSTKDMPTYIAYPHVIRDGSITPGQHASFLGKRHDPLFCGDEQVLGASGRLEPAHFEFVTNMIVAASAPMTLTAPYQVSWFHTYTLPNHQILYIRS